MLLQLYRHSEVNKGFSMVQYTLRIFIPMNSEFFSALWIWAKNYSYNIGKINPYGLGRIKVNITKLRTFDNSKYSTDR